MNRRDFVISIASGTSALVVAKPVFAREQSAPVGDPVPQLIVDQLRQAIVEIQNSNSRQEGVTNLESALRFWAAYAVSSGQEQRLVRTLKGRLEAGQHDALIRNMLARHETRHEELAKLLPGVDLSQLPDNTLSQEDAEKGLSQITTSGYSRGLIALADQMHLLRTRGRVQDARYRAVRRSCEDAQRGLLWAEECEAAFCTASLFDPEFIPACAAATLAVGACQFAVWYECGI